MGGEQLGAAALLGLRVGDHDIDLDGPVTVDWFPYDQRNTRFMVSIAGTVAADVIYRSLPADMDLGLLVRAVLSDAPRRAAIFA
jgi:homeobox protein ESX1